MNLDINKIKKSDKENNAIELAISLQIIMCLFFP